MASATFDLTLEHEAGQSRVLIQEHGTTRPPFTIKVEHPHQKWGEPTPARIYAGATGDQRPEWAEALSMGLSIAAELARRLDAGDNISPTAPQTSVAGLNTPEMLEVLDDADLASEAAWVRYKIIQDAATSRAIQGAVVDSGGVDFEG